MSYDTHHDIVKALNEGVDPAEVFKETTVSDKRLVKNIIRNWYLESQAGKNDSLM